MKTIGVIPARFASTRFPGKPLALIAGEPLLKWVIRGAQQAKSLSEIIVATDHQEIFALAEQCGVRAVMTNSSLPSGSDRSWAAVENEDCELVINIQGDEPLVRGEMIDQLVTAMTKDSSAEMGTLCAQLNQEELESKNVVKVVVNNLSHAIYFSRFSIPYSRKSAVEPIEGCFKHIGMYAFRKRFLKTFCQAPVAAIEEAESLEQLRALYLGAKIKVVAVRYESIGVDTPEDVFKVETILRDLYGQK